MASQLSLHCPGDLLGEVNNVVIIEASHGDPTVSRHVNVRLLSESPGLRRGKTGEAGGGTCVRPWHSH